MRLFDLPMRVGTLFSVVLVSKVTTTQHSLVEDYLPRSVNSSVLNVLNGIGTGIYFAFVRGVGKLYLFNN